MPAANQPRQSARGTADERHFPLASLRRRLRRVGRSWLLVLQLCLGASAAWLMATEVIGHAQPFFAPIAAVITVTAGGLGQRRRVVVDLVIGVAIGIGVGELLVGLIGRGTWQLALVVALAALAALLYDVGRLAVTQASTSAILLVTVIPAGTVESAALSRFVDALVGGVLGLVATALVPANPVRQLDHEVGAVLSELASLLDDTARALRWSDAGIAWTALQRGRALQDPLSTLTDTANTAYELSRISPLRWNQRDHVQLYAGSLRNVDHAVRDARVLTRRVHTMLRRGDSAGGVLSPVIERLAVAVRVFADDLAEQGRFDDVRDLLVETARQATTMLDSAHSLGVTVVVAQTRALAADLLYATGLTAVELDEMLGLGPEIDDDG